LTSPITGIAGRCARTTTATPPRRPARDELSPVASITF